jgi:hypothetical protein
VSQLRVVVADDNSLTLSGVADSVAANDISEVGRGSTAAEILTQVFVRLEESALPRV